MRSIALAPAFILPGTGLAVEDPVLGRHDSRSIPLGGDFKLHPKVAAFVVVGHGFRRLVSLVSQPRVSFVRQFTDFERVAISVRGRTRHFRLSPRPKVVFLSRTPCVRWDGVHV